MAAGHGLRDSNCRADRRSAELVGKVTGEGVSSATVAWPDHWRRLAMRRRPQSPAVPGSSQHAALGMAVNDARWLGLAL